LNCQQLLISNNFFRFEPIGLGAPVLAAVFLIQAVGEFPDFLLRRLIADDVMGGCAPASMS